MQRPVESRRLHRNPDGHSQHLLFSSPSTNLPVALSKLPFIMTDQPNPYSISVPDETLQELKQRLAWAKFPGQFESANQDPCDFGVPAREAQRLASSWEDGYDWRKAESQLNELPQYHTDIEVVGFGVLDIHCELSGSAENYHETESAYSRHSSCPSS